MFQSIVISHQHQSKLLWSSFSLEKEVVLHFPSAICSSLLSAAADIPSLQFPFSCFPLQSENFSLTVLFAILEESILQTQTSLLCSFDVIRIRWFGHRALKKLEGLLQSKQINLSYFVTFASHFHIKTHSFQNPYFRGLSCFLYTSVELLQGKFTSLCIARHQFTDEL